MMSAEVGKQLRQARVDRSLSLEQVSHATYMRVHYLEALEAGNLEALPSRAQTRGFLRAYAEYLELDPAPLLAQLAEVSTPIELATEDSSASAPPGDLNSGQIVAIFQEIGVKLRMQREILGLSIEDVSNDTHLSAYYLDAIESGELDDLPSMVQARGMLKNYASFLGMDPDPLLLRFADALQARLVARQKQRNRGGNTHSDAILQPPNPLRQFLSREMLLTAFLIVFFVGFVIWGIIQVLEMRSAQQQMEQVVTPPSIADILLATATVTETPTPQEPTAEAIEAAPVVILEETPLAVPVGEVDSTTVVQVYITINQRAWMRVVVDGEVEFDGRALPGSAYQFAGQQQVEVLTGNAAALQIFFQGRDLGPLGNLGQVVNQVYTLEGVLLPTPTITPTPSETPVPSPTPPQSETPQPALGL